VPKDLQPGDIVERYRVESTLGEGGTARVYRVRHTTLETVHALKVLTLDHPNIRARLIEEGKAQAKLSHPHIVPVRDVLDCDGIPALLMDFVPGRSLSAHIQGGLLSHAEVVRLFRGVVEGVDFAHSRGLIHRDLKPGNILIDQSNDPSIPRVTDFGLVRLLHLPADTPRRTGVGISMGTLGYMAPEQLSDAHSADERTDIFALGATLYTMLAGHPPFEGEDALTVMNATHDGRYTSIDEFLSGDDPHGFSEVIERCLQVDPTQRYQRARDVLDNLGHRGGKVDLHKAQNWNVSEVESSAPVSVPVPLPTIVVGPSTAVATENVGTVVTALVVDHAGRGHAAQLSVVIDPDGSGVQHPPDVARDAQVAAQLAVAVALGRDAESLGVRWTLRGMQGELQGTSLGLPLAVALRCARMGVQLPLDVAFTGGIDLDGRVAPVAGVPAKLRAAVESGCKTVYVPVDGLGQLDPPRGISIVPSRSFESTVVRLFPEASATSKTRFNVRWLALLVPVMMAVTSLTVRVEPLLHDPMLRMIHGALPAANTAILAFEPQRDARALRVQHPAVIDGLVNAGAKSIFFDVILLAATEHDAAIAAAIERARARGVQVVLPVMTENGTIQLPESESLRDAAWFGAVLAQADTTFWHVRRAPIRVRTVDGGEHWHAAVQTVRAHLGVKEPPRVDDGQLIVGPNRNPVWADLAYLHPAEPSPVMQYDDPSTWALAKGRSVLIGEMGGADDVHRTGQGAVYGVEIEASLVETLLQQRAPRMVSPEMNALFALLMGAYMAVMTTILPGRRRWTALSTPILGIVVGASFVVAGVLVSLLPMFVAVAIGWWIGRANHGETNQSKHP
jgi:serine/threonine protein kinase